VSGSREIAFDEGVFRQRERTIDNIKRIYAVVYSVSFAYILREILDYAEHWLNSSVSKGFASGLQLRLLLLLVFTSTVSVFAYQADKFLDLRYSFRPPGSPPTHMPRWHRSDFAIDAGSLILTLIPFVLMSYAFKSDLIDRYGVIPFVVSYLLQLGFAVVLLAFVRLKYILGAADRSVRRHAHAVAGPANAALSEEKRYAAVSIHWFVTNCWAVIALAVAFSATGPAPLCGTSMHPPLSRFVAVFVAIALLRNGFRAALGG